MQGMCKDFHQLRVKTMPAPLIKTGECLRRVTFNEYLQWANCRKRSFLPSICVEKFSHLANVLCVVLWNLSSLWQLVRHKRNKLQQKSQLLSWEERFSDISKGIQATNGSSLPREHSKTATACSAGCSQCSIRSKTLSQHTHSTPELLGSALQCQKK